MGDNPEHHNSDNQGRSVLRGAFARTGMALHQVQREAKDTIARFGDYYEANYRSIRRFVARLSSNPEDADDLAQEVFMRLWTELEAGTELIDPRAWLYRVAANLVTTRIRSKLRVSTRIAEIEQTIDQLRPDPFDIERAAIYREIVPNILDRLPEPMRLCLLLHHEGLSGTEMAQVVGVKPSYVGTLVLRAHERFRREYEQLGSDYGLPR